MMNRFLACLALCFALVSHGVVAAPAKPTEPDYRTLITAVDLKKNTIEFTHEDHGIKTTYLLAQDIVLRVNGKPGTVQQLKVGLQVGEMKLGSGMDDPAIIEELDVKTAAPLPKAK